MSKDKDRIETLDPWTQTIAEHKGQAKVNEKEGQKFINIKFPAQFQGHRMVHHSPFPYFRLDAKYSLDILSRGENDRRQSIWLFIVST